MAGKSVRLFALSVLLMAGGMQAWAQTAAPSTESVTVMGSRRMYHDFSRNFATPTKFTGKIARWERHICPAVVGQNPN